MRKLHMGVIKRLARTVIRRLIARAPHDVCDAILDGCLDCALESESPASLEKKVRAARSRQDLIAVLAARDDYHSR
jgi:hypothetical protein